MKLLHRVANGYVVLALLAMTIAMSVFMKLSIANLQRATGDENVKIPDAHLWYSGDTAYELLYSYGEEGRSICRASETREDVIYPILYGSFLFFSIVFFFSRIFPSRPRLSLLAVLAVFTVLFDATENACIVLMIDHFPEQNLPLGDFCGMMTLMKWIFATLTVITMIVGFWMFVFRKKLT